MNKTDLARARLQQNAPQLLEEATRMVEIRDQFLESKDPDDKRALIDAHNESYKRMKTILKTIKGE